MVPPCYKKDTQRRAASHGGFHPVVAGHTNPGTMAGSKRDEQVQPSNGYDRPSNGYDPVQQEERDHTNLEMPNINEQQEAKHLSSNGNAQGPKEEPEPGFFSSAFSKYGKVIIIVILSIIIVILLIVIGILACPVSSTTENQKIQAVQTGTSVPLNCQEDAPIYSCSLDWTGLNGNCYKESEFEKNWEESQNSCILLNASLAKTTEEERKGIMWKYTRDHGFWIGLTREPDQPWKWLDGENATVEIMGDGGNCAFLHSDGTIMSMRCSNEHFFLCKKSMSKRS